MTTQPVLASSHAEWLSHPITRMMFQQILDKQIESLTDKISDNSISTDLSDATIRHYAVQLKTLKTIKKVLYDTETFIARTKQ
jgi:hypothetical protein